MQENNVGDSSTGLRYSWRPFYYIEKQPQDLLTGAIKDQMGKSGKLAGWGTTDVFSFIYDRPEGSTKKKYRYPMASNIDLQCNTGPEMFRYGS